MERLREGLKHRLLSFRDLCPGQPDGVELVVARSGDDGLFRRTDGHVHYLVQRALGEVLSIKIYLNYLLVLQQLYYPGFPIIHSFPNGYGMWTVKYVNHLDRVL